MTILVLNDSGQVIWALADKRGGGIVPNGSTIALKAPDSEPPECLKDFVNSEDGIHRIQREAIGKVVVR
jgi:hypothetical protein